MPAQRKIIVTGMPYFVTFRSEQGLPFPCNPLIKHIFLSNMAMAQELYPVTISHFVLIPNHMHLVLIPKDPQDFCAFIEYLKRETAHSVNRLLGRRKRTLWLRGYDSPILLDKEATIKRIGYTYLNPRKANLIDHIANYPGLSSWRYRSRDTVKLQAKRIPRSNFQALRDFSLNSMKKELKRLLKLPCKKCTLELNPNAWMECFQEQGNKDKLHQEIDKKIKEKHKELAKEAKGKPLGKEALEKQAIDLPYTSEKYSPKMICLGVCRESRKRFISWAKAISALAKDAYWNFRERLVNTLAIPPGLFAPGKFSGGLLSPKDCPI